MNKLYNPPRENWDDLLQRPVQAFSKIEEVVRDVFSQVVKEGDAAIGRFTRQFDEVELDKWELPEDQFNAADEKVNPELKRAIRQAKANIEKFHKAQRSAKITVETTAGVKCWQEKKPIEKVGLYIPGGSAPLFSTVLMLAIPAVLAGCREIVLCSPPDGQGRLHPAIIFTAKLCGIDRIFRVGGIQAIAGMAFGTQSIPKVYKIFGPGNQYVTVAKQLATNFGVAIDMPAGPSELLIAADDSADPSFVAADLLSQAEHGPDSQVLLVTTSTRLMEAVEKELSRQLEDLPRKNIAAMAIANSKLILVQDDETAVELINAYAPEHYIICCRHEAFYLQHTRNAGSVFVGNYTPESAGDYASGTNHTLPTNGYARQYSGVNLDSFMKSITFQKISAEGIQNLGPTIEIMAEAEGLRAHKNAVTLRLEKLKSYPETVAG